jgi:hypothetical protein
MIAGGATLILKLNTNYRGNTMRSIIKKFLILSLITLFTFVFHESPFAKDWHEEFEYICSKVEMGDSLSIEDLKSLIERADALLKTLENVNEPSKKIYIFRLKKCKAFFEYLIELKGSNSGNPSP